MSGKRFYSFSDAVTGIHRQPLHTDSPLNLLIRRHIVLRQFAETFLVKRQMQHSSHLRAESHQPPAQMPDMRLLSESAADDLYQLVSGHRSIIPDVIDAGWDILLYQRFYNKRQVVD